ncbi:MAG: ADP-ribosylglycohydrolase family protein [Candidatus Bathyarchaeia archaeon]
MKDLFDKAYGCLAGVAIGDAMGMPTSFYTPNQIKQKFGFVDRFLDAPEDHPIHSGLVAYQVTDDTQLTIVIANVIIDNGKVTAESVAKHILDWALSMKVLESDLIGPSTKKALKNIMAGVSPKYSGKLGTTNGAAMRISPVAIFNANDEKSLIEDVEKACLPTHGTNVAISAASAVAFAIAEGLSAKNNNIAIDSIVEAAIKGAKAGAKKGFEYPAASVYKRIELALELIGKAKNCFDAAIKLYDYIGAGFESNEAIPTAIGIFVAAKGDPMTAIKCAVNIGGDADTIASIVGGISGAFKGVKAFKKIDIENIKKVNRINIESIIEKILKKRNEKLKV